MIFKHLDPWTSTSQHISAPQAQFPASAPTLPANALLGALGLGRKSLPWSTSPPSAQRRAPTETMILQTETIIDSTDGAIIN